MCTDGTKYEALTASVQIKSATAAHPSQAHLDPAPLFAFVWSFAEALV